jgi:hypothetical protein
MPFTAEDAESTEKNSLLFWLGDLCGKKDRDGSIT